MPALPRATTTPRSSDNGPSHVIVNGLYLGVVAPDSDPGTLQDLDATCGQLRSNINDEDGVEFLPSVDTDTTEVLLPVRATNTTGSTATMACWIDFNLNGVFDTGERSQLQPVPANSGAVELRSCCSMGSASRSKA